MLYCPDGEKLTRGIAPITGSPNWIGDKACYHVNWEGTLIAMPEAAWSAVTLEKHVGENIYHNMFKHTVGTTTKRWNALGVVGESGSWATSWTKTYRQVDYRQDMKVEWYWLGLQYLIVHISSYDEMRKKYSNRSVVTEFKQDTSTPFSYARQRIADLNDQDTGNTFHNVYPASTDPFYRAAMYTLGSHQALPRDFIRDNILDLVQGASSSLEESLPDIPRGWWGEIADRAIQDAQALNINSIAYARDIVSLKHQIASILKMLKGGVSPKKLADIWLSFRYGLRLTFRDSGELGKAIGRAVVREYDRKWSKCRATDTSVSTIRKGRLSGLSLEDKYNLTVYYNPCDDKFLSVIRRLMDWDAMLSLQNVWDLIPLSFVVDWFVDVSNMLEGIDTNTYLNTLRILGVIKTRKSMIKSIPPECLALPRGIAWSGCLHLSIYNRKLESTLDLPLYRSTRPEGFSNWADLAAILTQRIRRR